MRLTAVLLMGCLAFSFYSYADDDGPSEADVKTLFFGKDDRLPVSQTATPPWEAIGSWKQRAVTFAVLP